MIAYRHPESWVADADLTSINPPYRKSTPFENDRIDAFHCQIDEDGKTGMYAGPIKGSLRTADALKLYELAYFSTGDILELGTYHGLSSWIMASALKNAGSKNRIVSIDLEKGLSDLAHKNLEQRGLPEYVDYRTDDGASGMDKLATEGRAFAAAFIDHSHSYQHVYDACARLPRVMRSGSPVLFHDFNDKRNADPTNNDYGVRQAVMDAASEVGLRFVGIYGCAGLYEYAP